MIPQPPHDIVRAVRAELAWPGRYHLHDHTASVQRSWLDMLFQWIYDRFVDFQNALGSHIRIGATGATIIGDLLIGAAVVLVAFVAARLMMTLQAEQTAHVEATHLGAMRSASVLARAAADAAAGGDYARAIRFLFAAAVTLLDLRGVVRDEASATVNDLRRALHERYERADVPFVTISRAYTTAAYAEQRLDEGTWNNARAAYAQLLDVVNQAS